MGRSLLSKPLISAISVFSLTVLTLPAFAEPGPEPDGSIPDDPRDFSGVWMNDNTFDETLKRAGLNRLAPGETFRLERPRPSLTSEYASIHEARMAQRAQLAVGAESCSWPGMPGIMTYPYPLEILHTPGRITLIFEAESQVRRLFLDRSEHLPFEELDPSYNGDSIAHWEGDTLVVDSVGFHSATELPGGFPHSEQMRIVERIQYIDGDTIRVDMQITDPLALEEPFEQTVIYSKRPTWSIREYSCMENNRDAPNAEGERSHGVIE